MRWMTSLLPKDLKIKIQPQQYVIRPFIMSESIQTPLRNPQRPPRLQGDKMETHRRWRTSWLHRDLKINIHPQYVTRPFIMSESTQTTVRNLQRPPRLHEDKMETHLRWRTAQLYIGLKIIMHPHQYATRPFIMSKTTQTPVINLQRLLRLQDDKLDTHKRWKTSWLHRDLKINRHQNQYLNRQILVSESI